MWTARARFAPSIPTATRPLTAATRSRQACSRRLWPSTCRCLRRLLWMSSSTRLSGTARPSRTSSWALEEVGLRTAAAAAALLLSLLSRAATDCSPRSCVRRCCAGASVFTPPVNFWSSSDPPYGATYSVPSGLHYAADMDERVASWTRPDTGFVHAFHGGYWGSWVFAVQGVDLANRSILFGSGGFQEARGSRGIREWSDTQSQAMRCGQAAPWSRRCSRSLTDVSPPR